MAQLNARERAILAVTLILVGLFAMDRWVGAPVSASWAEMDHAIARKRAQLAYDKRLLAESVRIKKEYAARRSSQRDTIDDQRPGGMTRMLKEIESLARSSGVKISDIRPQTQAGSSGSSASIVLSVESGWESMTRFFYQMQRSPQLLHVEKASLHRRANDSVRLNGRFVIAVTRGEDVSPASF